MRMAISVWVMSAILSSCSAPAAPSAKPFQDLNGIKFGDSFRSTLAAASPTRFNPASVVACDKELPIKGCFLTDDDDSAPFIIRDGIPYRLQASFNRKDQLTEMTLVFESEDATSEQCQDVTLRTLDWLSRDYGALADHALKHDASSHQILESANGNEFLTTKPDADGWLGEAMRKFPNKRSLWLLSHFMVLSGKGKCDIAAQFSDASLPPFAFDSENAPD